jgi:hypothetical protein
VEGSVRLPSGADGIGETRQAQTARRPGSTPFCTEERTKVKVGQIAAATVAGLYGSDGHDGLPDGWLGRIRALIAAATATVSSLVMRERQGAGGAPSLGTAVGATPCGI